ncbi:MAG: Na/Pi cotransporter, partial [Spirochaetae bacterium HGW-Spirochaetae-8]
GTTVTAFLASIGTNVNARRASRVHTLFNIFGVIWMTFLFAPFLQLVNTIVPGDIYAEGGAQFLPGHLAMFHTLFNITNTLFCSFFFKQIALVVTKLVPDDEAGMPTTYKLKYISATLQDTPELYLLTVERELSKMAIIISDMFGRFWEVFNNPKKNMTEEIESQKKMEDLTDKMQVEITQFLSQCSLDNMNKVSAANVYSMMRITNELERIGDSCFNLMILAERRAKWDMELDETSIQKLFPYVDLVNQFLRFIRSHLNEHVTSENLAVALELEDRINRMRNILKQSAAKRMQAGANVKTELLYIDVVRHVEQIGDHCLNITESLQQVH